MNQMSNKNKQKKFTDGNFTAKDNYINERCANTT